MPDEPIATTVADSPAHAAWTAQPDAPAAAPSAPDAAPAASAAPPPPAPDTSAVSPELLEGATPAAPTVPKGPVEGQKAESLQDATKAFLARAATKPTPAAGAQAEATKAAAKATVAGATPAEAAAAGAQAAKDYLEALGADGKPYNIPLGVKIPIKVNGRTVMVPMSDVPKGLMLQQDYQYHRQRDADARRAFDAEKVRLEALRTQLDDDRKQFEAAQTDPEQYERWQQHLEMLRTNPLYKENWERGRSAAIDSAELSAYRGAEVSELERQAANDVLATLTNLSAEYPGANPDLVRQQYADALQHGQAELTEASIRRFYQAEQSRGHAYVAPLRSELDAMKAEVARLRQAQADADAAAAHNATTRRALERDSQGRFTAPSGGAAPDVPREPAPTPFTSHELEARKRAWINKERRDTA